ncbi:MAG TPA: aromatic ring-hydroxylating dioxygenase subunit alpha [Rhizomicrobium sp.]|jgi:phenylpropionate dioxygenase-like ring-hydroxylating dioxygenase large terminal subunit
MQTPDSCGARVDLRRVDTHPDFWYPVAWSHDIKKGRTLGVRFSGEPVVLYRGASGNIFALEDRCAHRQVPLHLGKVEGDTLKCGYHGWAYNCAGKCIDVPYLGSDALPNGVRSYPAHEVDGLVFLFPGNPKVAEPRKPARIGARNDARYLTRRLNRQVACHYTFMHENLFDMNHQFLHRRQMGMIRARCLGRRLGEDWCEVDYTFSRTSGRASIGESAILNVLENNSWNDRRDLMTIRTNYPYQRLKFWVDAGDPVLDVWLGYTPLDKEQKTNRTFGHLSVKKPRFAPLLYLAWPFISWFTENIFREDKDIVEEEQAAHDAQGADWNNEIFPAIRDLRGLLARCGAGGTAAAIPAE